MYYVTHRTVQNGHADCSTTNHMTLGVSSEYLNVLVFDRVFDFRQLICKDF